MKKIIAFTMAVILIVSVLAGCGSSKDKPVEYETFLFDELVFQIPKDLALKEGSVDGYDYCLESDHLMLVVSVVSKALIESAGYEIEDLKQVAFEDLGAPQTVGITETAEYHNSVDGSDFFYTYSFVDGKDNVYDVHLMCTQAEETKYKDTMYDILSKIELAK